MVVFEEDLGIDVWCCLKFMLSWISWPSVRACVCCVEWCVGGCRLEATTQDDKSCTLLTAHREPLSEWQSEANPRLVTVCKMKDRGSVSRNTK